MKQKHFLLPLWLCRSSAVMLSLILAAAFSSFSSVAGYAIQTSLSFSDAEPVPGANNVTFCTVPRSEQLFHIDFFDIAPLPIPL